MASEIELLTVGRISIDLYCDQAGADWPAARSFSRAAGGIVVSRLLCSQAMPHEREVVELLQGTPA